MSLRRLLPALVLAPLGFAAAPAQAAFVCNTPDCVLPTSSTTGTTGGTVRGNMSTRFSIGFQWSFGAAGPELTAALRRTETTPHQQVYGAQADVSLPINLIQPLQWPTFRMLAVGGNRDFQGLGGFGIQTGTWAPLIAGGVSGPYTHGGANFIFGQGLVPYIGVNAFSRAVAPTRTQGNGTTTLSCGSGYTLSTVSSLLFPVNSALVSNGKTCLGPT